MTIGRGAAAAAACVVAMLAGCDASSPPVLGAVGACPLPAASVPQPETPCSERSDPRLAEMSDAGIGLTSELGLPPGRYVLPGEPAPTQLVVFFHGHQNDSCSWRNHLRETAARGAIAVAMNYTGQADREIEGFGFVENWGWFVRSGAADSITAARYFMSRYPSITEVFNFGASMGGNVSAYALYSDDAVRADCSKLWDWWVVTEGVHNLTEEYTGARTLAPTLEAAAQAQREIEEENGGTLEEVPEAYAEITNTAHADGMAYLKGVVLTHGTTDQTVPFDQSNQMASALRANGVPAHLFAITPSGHAWEGDETEPVMGVGLSELYRLMAGGTVTDGQTTVPNP